MARRRRQDDGLFDELFELAGKVPMIGVWIGAVFAIVGGYFTWINPKANSGTGSFFGDIAFLIAGAFCVMSLIGTIRNRTKRTVRAQRLDAVLSIEDLRHMDWRQFEQLVADAFRRQGFRVKEVGGSGDGGVDLVLVGPDGIEHLVQCKQYRAWDVGEPKVREFYGAMAAHRTRCEGIIVTCGRFTEPARRFAQGKPLRLIDGEALVKLIGNTNPIAPAVNTFIAPPEPQTQQMPPVCPTCAIPMVKRTAKKGPQAGQDFWGCRNYPQCRQIIQFEISSSKSR